MSDGYSEDYETFCRPEIGKLLRTLKMDVSYTSAKGSRMLYSDQGLDKSVVDGIGGFGSCFFGHNDPTLKAKCIELLEKDAPFLSQASIRHSAGLLGKKINAMFSERFGGEYISLITNTGSEAVETSIKHACYRLNGKRNAYLKRYSESLVKVRSLLADAGCKLDSNITQKLYEFTEDYKVSDDLGLLNRLEEAVDTIINANTYKFALEKAYHGKTTGAIKLTHAEKFRGPFDKIGLDTLFINPLDPSSLDRAIAQCTVTIPRLVVKRGVVEIREDLFCLVAGILIEPIQGEGGIREITDTFISEVRKHADKSGFLVIFDEIQTGMGRTGQFLFSETYREQGDCYLLAKSLGGGLVKISACIINTESFEQGFDEIHSTTFSEDELSCSIANAALDKLQDGRLFKQSQEKGAYLRKGLSQLKEKYPNLLLEVRGQGLMCGFELADQEKNSSLLIRNLDKSDALGHFICSFLLQNWSVRLACTISDNRVIRVQPPVTTSTEELDIIIEAVDQAFMIINKANGGALIKHLISNPGVEEIKNYNYDYVPLSDDADTSVMFIAPPESTSAFIHADKSLEIFSGAELNKLYQIVRDLGSFLELESKIIKASSGESTKFRFVALPYSPEQMYEDIRENNTSSASSLVFDAIDYAIDEGCTALGLGSYTSIITKNGLSIKNDQIALTTGNSLTVASSAEALLNVAVSKGIVESDIRACIVGAVGNIGEMYAHYISSKVGEMVLVGREGSERRLIGLANSIYYEKIQAYLGGELLESSPFSEVISFLEKKLDLASIISEEIDVYDLVLTEFDGINPLQINCDMAVLKDCNLIVSTSNAAEPIIFKDMLGSHKCIISDVSVPQDVDDEVSKLNNCTVLNGGIVMMPEVNSITFKGLPNLDTNESYACMAETIIMGLLGTKEHYSYGKLEVNKVNRIAGEASKLGFQINYPKMKSAFQH